MLLSFCLTFCQFQPDIDYKGVACEKACTVVHDAFIDITWCTTPLSVYNSEADVRRRSLKKVFLEISQNSQETSVSESLF